MPPVLLLFQQRVCINEVQRKLVTASAANWHGNLVNYGRTNGGALANTIGLGEGGASGAWAGAGLNGGTNVAFMVNSCGVRGGPSNFFNAATFRHFAGVHSLHMLAPVAAWKTLASGSVFASDARAEPQRGSDLAWAIKNNPNSPVTWAWLNSTNAGYSFTAIQVSGPPTTPANYPWGCAISIARDNTAARADWHLNSETWAQAKSESNDALGNQYWAATIFCNYDRQTYGF